MAPLLAFGTIFSMLIKSQWNLAFPKSSFSLKNRFAFFLKDRKIVDTYRHLEYITTWLQKCSQLNSGWYCQQTEHPRQPEGPEVGIHVQTGALPIAWKKRKDVICIFPFCQVG